MVSFLFYVDCSTRLMYHNALPSTPNKCEEEGALSRDARYGPWLVLVAHLITGIASALDGGHLLILIGKGKEDRLGGHPPNPIQRTSTNCCAIPS